MNKRDTVKLLAFVAAFDQRTVGEADVEAWSYALADIPLDETAREAVVAFYSGPGRDERRWMQPHDFRTARKRIRADRLARVTLPPPNDAPGVSYPEELRALERAVGDGRITDQRDADAYTSWGGSLHLSYLREDFPELSAYNPPELKARDVPALLAGAWRETEGAVEVLEGTVEPPEGDPGTAERALSVQCPWKACRALPGEPCVGAYDAPHAPHPSRVEAAEAATD